MSFHKFYSTQGMFASRAKIAQCSSSVVTYLHLMYVSIAPDPWRRDIGPTFVRNASVEKIIAGEELLE